MAPYIGTPTSRIDGIAKVTGAAKYAAEFNVPGGVLYGSIVPSTIAKGRITRLDTSAAMGVEGVMTVLKFGGKFTKDAYGGPRSRLQGRRGAGRVAVPAAVR